MSLWISSNKKNDPNNLLLLGIPPMFVVLLIAIIMAFLIPKILKPHNNNIIDYYKLSEERTIKIESFNNSINVSLPYLISERYCPETQIYILRDTLYFSFINEDTVNIKYIGDKSIDSILSLPNNVRPVQPLDIYSSYEKAKLPYSIKLNWGDNSIVLLISEGCIDTRNTVMEIINSKNKKTSIYGLGNTALYETGKNGLVLVNSYVCQSLTSIIIIKPNLN